MPKSIGEFTREQIARSYIVRIRKGAPDLTFRGGDVLAWIAFHADRRPGDRCYLVERSETELRPLVPTFEVEP